MPKVVLDTNILVSAFLTKKGNPAQILDMFTDRKIELYYCLAIIEEYKDVLLREKLGFMRHKVYETIGVILQKGVLVEPQTSTMPLPDESDRIFYDAAKAAGAYLVTGNIKHYPKAAFIVTPAAFLQIATGLD
jgi:putative PIN family toxin of toxin-antitoxin system